MPTATQREDLIYRSTKLNRADFKSANGKRTLDVCFSSETPVLRSEKGFQFWEVLSHDPQHADISLLQDGGALVDEHNFDRQFGSVEKAWISGDRKGRARLSFADTDLANDRWDLMSTGHRKDISFGYVHTKLLGEKRGERGLPVKTFAWKAYEITSTAIGADHFETGVGRSFSTSHNQHKITMTESPTDIAEISALTTAYLEDWPNLRSDILTLKARALSGDFDHKGFKKEVLTLIQSNPQARKQNVMQRVLPHEIGMGQHEINSYSLHRALQNMSSNGGKLGPSFELDVSQQVEKNSRSRCEGFFIPTDVVLGRNCDRGYTRNFERDMTAGDFATGGAAVATQILPFIDILRNRTVCNRLGATMLGGLTSNVAFPRETAPTTPASMPEVGQLPDSNITLDQVLLTPHRVGVTVTYSKQLVFQSTPDIEGIIRNDSMAQVGLKHDALFLNGTGQADQPLGILNRTDVAKLPFGGPATYASIVAFETAVAKANADVGALAYATTPNVRGKWKQIAVALAGATTVSSRALWEKGNFGDGSNDGLVNDYRAAASNQIPNDLVIYGNWTDFVTAYFGGFDIVYDPYTSAKKAQIVTTINTWIDCAPRHGQSFAISTDAGSQ